jgi:hypothetical protein
VWTAIHSVDTTVHEHAWNYSMARDAYLKVQDPSGDSLELPCLQLTDLRVNTAILGTAQIGQRNTQLPWDLELRNLRQERWYMDG